MNNLESLRKRVKKYLASNKGKEKFFDRINYLKKEKQRNETLTQRSLRSLAEANKLTLKKCVMCPNYMQSKKHKYCSSKCSRKAEAKLAKLRRLKIYG